MAHSKQAKKRVRQNERVRLHNKALATRMRSQVKQLLALCASGDRAGAEAALPTAMKHVDKAAKHRVIHPNTAARRKNMMARAIQRIGG